MAVIDLPFDGILGSLAAGDCDVVGSAVSITDERKEQVDFSEPYFDSAQSLLIKAEDGGEITSLEDFDGRPLGVQSGTTGETYANENATGATVTSFEDSDGLFAALEAGEIDGILQDLPVNGYRTTQDDSLVVIESSPRTSSTASRWRRTTPRSSTSSTPVSTSLRDDGRLRRDLRHVLR